MRSLKSELVKLTDSIEFQVRETHAPSSSSPIRVCVCMCIKIEGHGPRVGKKGGRARSADERGREKKV